MGAVSAMKGFMLFISLVGSAVLAESPPVDDCVTTMPPVCPINEERRCQDPCIRDTCEILYTAYDCFVQSPCVERCYCKEGFLRIGENGPCVTREECNPYECVNDMNAQRGCGDKCGKTCSDYDTNPVCSNQTCSAGGCDCKEGHVYDQNKRLCVKPEECTVPCKPNEWYSTCLLNECGPSTCEDVGRPATCPPRVTGPCQGGCVCQVSYVKDQDGNCIDAKTCPNGTTSSN